jgi:hypothetical protein
MTWDAEERLCPEEALMHSWIQKALLEVSPPKSKSALDGPSERNKLD